MKTTLSIDYWAIEISSDKFCLFVIVVVFIAYTFIYFVKSLLPKHTILFFHLSYLKNNNIFL